MKTATNITKLLVGHECLIKLKNNGTWIKATIIGHTPSNGFWNCKDAKNNIHNVCKNTDRRLIIGKDDGTTLLIYNDRIESIGKRRESAKVDEWKSIFVYESDDGYCKVEFTDDNVVLTPTSANISLVEMTNDKETEDEDQQLEIRKAELDEKEQKLDEKEQKLDEHKLELDNREKECDNRDEESKKRKLELDERKLELDNHEKECNNRDGESKKRKLELDKREQELGNDQLANKQTLLDGMMQLAEESKHPMAVLVVKELEELLSSNNTTQLDQNIDKIEFVLQRLKSSMLSHVEKELAYSMKEYCNMISILKALHSEDVTTKKAELASNELHGRRVLVENAVNAAKTQIKQKLLVESFSKVVEEGQGTLKEIDTQLKTLYGDANEELKKKYNDKLSAIMQTETDDELVLEEDENAKAEWNDYIEKDHFAN